MELTDIQKYKQLSLPIQPTNWFDNESLWAEQGNELVFDIESFPNYFLIAFKSFKTGLTITFENSPEVKLDKRKLKWITKNFILIGFSSTHYDIPMLNAALAGFSTERLMSLTMALITTKSTIKEIKEAYDLEVDYFNHIDIENVATGRWTSLKTYAARLHAPRLQDLPVKIKNLTQEEALNLKYYCINDLDCTAYLYQKIQPEIKLRKDLSKRYGIDLRSKSDAQIAEAVISKEIKEITGVYPSRPSIESVTFSYDVPKYLNFTNESLKQLVKDISNHEFEMNANGSIHIPKHLKRKIRLNKSTYQVGIGGLHSTENQIAHHTDDKFLILDYDVASYYPNIILNQKLYPEHLGENFLYVYKDVVDRRLKAKAEGDVVTSNGLKIAINGSFGKFASPYSKLYAPNLMMQVTITGQLSLLLLIERIENIEIQVVSANTDGIVIKCPQGRLSELEEVIKRWEIDTKFKTEKTEYASLYMRDVNNYIAIKDRGDSSYKVKGVFSREAGSPPSVLGKNPIGEIIIDAVIRFLINNTSLEETIIKCKDVTKFLFVRKVKGGAFKDGVYLGKTVRWYYKRLEFGTINYANGNKVPNTEGAWPYMLIKNFPKDIDYVKYIKEARSMLHDIGYYGSKDRQLELFQ